MAMVTPEKLASSGSEDGTQMAYIQYTRTQLVPFFPEALLIYHTPNGGQRGDAQSAMITGGKMKAMGAQKGVPDICLPVNRCGYNNLYIEFKEPTGTGRLHREQYDYLLMLAKNGNLVAIIDNWAAAGALTLYYLQNDIETIRHWVDYNITSLANNDQAMIVDPSRYAEKFKRNYQKKK